VIEQFQPSVMLLIKLLEIKYAIEFETKVEQEIAVEFGRYRNSCFWEKGMVVGHRDGKAVLDAVVKKMAKWGIK
jgi:isoprenylcysteine carboxyl methyltransferase (ICMT) family protein YpbQ